MCEFCENEKRIEFDNGEFTWFIRDAEKGYEMFYENHKTGKLKAITISNCPICGRKLTDVEEKHLREHEEKFTKCDKCARLEECKENRKVINVQCGCEEVPHYALNIGEICEKEAEKDRDVEELIDEIKKLNGRHQSDCITINQLQTTIDVLVDKLSRLREVHGL